MAALGLIAPFFLSQAQVLAQEDLGLQVLRVGPTHLGSVTSYQRQEVGPWGVTPVIEPPTCVP